MVVYILYSKANLYLRALLIEKDLRTDLKGETQVDPCRPSWAIHAKIHHDYLAFVANLKCSILGSNE